MKLEQYFRQVSSVLQQLPLEDITVVVHILERAREEGRRVFLFGNGGSAATASHFGCDLSKSTVQEGRPRFRVIILNDNVPMLTAYANDVGYEVVFAEPLASLGEPGDVAIGISASGNSPNVLRAMDVARKRGMTTIGITGYQGQKLKEKVDVCVIVSSDSMQQIEDAQLVILHAVFLALC